MPAAGPAAAIGAPDVLAWNAALGLAASGGRGRAQSGCMGRSLLGACCALPRSPPAVAASARIITDGTCSAARARSLGLAANARAAAGGRAVGAMAGPQMQTTQVGRPGGRRQGWGSSPPACRCRALGSAAPAPAAPSADAALAGLNVCDPAGGDGCGQRRHGVAGLLRARPHKAERLPVRGRGQRDRT